MKKLSICIPTRNRQSYCIDALSHLARSLRTDFEVIVADNSDDPAPLADYIDELGDPRFRLIAPEAEPLSMMDNWERLIPATSGEWVSFIGDDDYIDPDLGQLLEVIEMAMPNADAVSWSRIVYSWPDARSDNQIVAVPTESHLRHIGRKDMLKALFYWEGASDRPKNPFGVYHGAVRRTLLDTMRDTFGGRYFDHPIVDYENICKIALVAQCMIHCDRPMSVYGACAKSNSTAVRDMAAADRLIPEFRAENRLPVEHPDFPFPMELGITAVIANVIESMKAKFGVDVEGWQENFVKACIKDCEFAYSLADFNRKKRGYAEAFAQWESGKYAIAFRPQFRKHKSLPRFRGYSEGHIYVKDDIGGAATAAEFYQHANLIMFAVSAMEKRLLGTAPTAKAAAA